MKNYLLPFIILSALFLISATSPKIQPQNHTLEGAWELISFYNYNEDNEISDTVPTSEGYRQIKMYQAGKVMWTRYVPKDSIEWFGYGSYTNTDSELVETLEYGSNSMMRIIDTLRVFKFELVLGKEHFTQITVDDDGQRVFSENYKRLN
ncbi:hypothetical protein SAMN04487906_2888 [Zhouia amylolytica]|uniref:Lipocalin-like domain-containing protein n=2 Tax=Zhouia amylolytica TaxID=376730 RepID=W2UT43_9FLAO|nr:hypothetical protein [Zhouia amylolytica]ETN96502.1 hypothetical protein P278_05800 [Zhouia amylolytica AD3]SFT09062.1 hypothetical protein SAMN04487906_2888 [Zhouia amylolytica]